MSDVMNIRKVFSPISPTHGVHRLKKKHPDSKQKGFEKDLEEEKEDEKEKREEGNFSGESADPGADIKKRNTHGTVGTRVDIQV